MTRERALFGLALLLIGLSFWRYRGRSDEDFSYYRCAGALAARGGSPYEPAPYQACLDSARGRPNPHVSAGTGYPYLPTGVVLFEPLGLLSHGRAFLLWNLVLLGAALLTAAALRRGPLGAWAPLLLAAWPGFILAAAYHKLMLAQFALALLALRALEQGRDARCGALLSPLTAQPHWAAGFGLLLALRRRPAALAVMAGLGALAAAALAAQLGGWAYARQWAANVAGHGNLVTLDNQSLFVALYKPLMFLAPQPTAGVQAARLGLGALLGLAACALKRSPPAFLACLLLAFPYSHGSDSLWAFPLYLSTLETARERLAWTPGKAAAAALAAQLALAAAFAFYAPESITRAPLQSAQGYLTVGVAAASLLFHIIVAR